MWLIASRSKRTLNHNCVPNTWWSARSIDSNRQHTQSSFVHLFFCFFFIHNFILFYFIYLGQPRVVVCVCVCDVVVCALHLIWWLWLELLFTVYVHVHAMRLTLAFVFTCPCAFCLCIRSRSFLWYLSVYQCNAYIQTHRNRHLHGNRLRSRSIVLDLMMCDHYVRLCHTDQRYSVSAHLNTDTINIHDACKQSIYRYEFK